MAEHVAEEDVCGAEDEEIFSAVWMSPCTRYPPVSQTLSLWLRKRKKREKMEKDKNRERKKSRRKDKLWKKERRKMNKQENKIVGAAGEKQCWWSCLFWVFLRDGGGNARVL